VIQLATSSVEPGGIQEVLHRGAAVPVRRESRPQKLEGGRVAGTVFEVPEERVLRQELDGYDAYMRSVRSRFLPHV